MKVTLRSLKNHHKETTKRWEEATNDVNKSNLFKTLELTVILIEEHIDRYLESDDHAFFNHIDKEFTKVAEVATASERATFAFGSIEEAIESFEKIEEETKE